MKSAPSTARGVASAIKSSSFIMTTPLSNGESMKNMSVRMGLTLSSFTAIAGMATTEHHGTNVAASSIKHNIVTFNLNIKLHRSLLLRLSLYYWLLKMAPYMMSWPMLCPIHCNKFPAATMAFHLLS